MSTPLHDGALLRMSAITAACVSALMVENHVARIDWIKVLATMGDVRAAEVNSYHGPSLISLPLQRGLHAEYGGPTLRTDCTACVGCNGTVVGAIVAFSTS